MNTVLVQYGHPVCTKQYTKKKKKNAKHAVKAEISIIKDIVQRLGRTFSV